LAGVLRRGGGRGRLRSPGAAGRLLLPGKSPPAGRVGSRRAGGG